VTLTTAALRKPRNDGTESAHPFGFSWSVPDWWSAQAISLLVLFGDHVLITSTPVARNFVRLAR
jgi:hypothetical protein